jgi:putative chitinase
MKLQEEMITSNTLIRIAPRSIKVADIIPGLFYEFAGKYEINNSKRIAAFFAETIVESASFTATREFASGAAYEGRKDLGNTYPGDGKLYKGRGYIQITGRNNYAACSKALFGDNTLIKNPDLLSTPKYAMQSAMWFWKSNDLNRYADMQYFYTISVRINGKNKNGLPNNWADRVHFYNLFCAEFGLPLYDIDTRSIFKI